MKFYPKPKHLYLLLTLAISLTISCSNDGDGGGGDSGSIESGIIPAEIYEEFVGYMPIYEGKNPPDISGEYLASKFVLVKSSISSDSPEISFSDMYFAFIKNSNGKLKYMERQGNSTYSSDDVNVKIVGENNNFTAYFVNTGEASGIYTKESTIISGTLTSEGIRDFHYSFVILEKGNDPDYILVPVNTYRIFKDNDGLAENYNWVD